MDPQINKAVNDVKNAKNTAALGAEFAAEYVDFKGIKVWYKTVSHAWIIPAVTARCEGISNFEVGLLTFYILTHDPEGVRNKIMQELKEGNILDKAMDYMIEHQICPEDLEELDIAALMRNPYAKN